MRMGSKLRNVIASLLLAAPVVSCTSVNTSEKTDLSEHESEADQCTFTQGYWQNHPEAWPVDELLLGDENYSQAELLLILEEEVGGNGLIALAHQLIAAKLNVAYGAPAGEYADDIEAADSLLQGYVVPPIGEGYIHPSLTSALVDVLDAFNNSQLRGDACEEEPPPPPPPACGDGTVDAGEQCDDGNTTAGDGCSATCQHEPPPPPPPACGDGTVDDGEQCDDGNTTDGDGCSATCHDEPPPPPPPTPCCGDGHLDAGEQCDDGNTTSGDGCSATCTIEPVCEGTHY